MADQAGPLSAYRVVDLTSQYGVLGTRIMAGLGAEVIRVEPPGGDPMRTMAPTVPGVDGSPASLYWAQMNGAKKSVVLDLDDEQDRVAFWSLLATADVLFESGQRERLESLGIGWDEIARRCPDLVYTTISPFGIEGPHAHWRGGDLIAMAAGGLMYLCGDPDRAPLRVAVEQGSAQVGLQAMVGTLIALRARKVGARGQRVDVSMQEAVTLALGNSQQTFVMTGEIYRRAGGGRATGVSGSRLVWQCRDGYVAWGRNPASMGILHQWMLDEGHEPGFDPIAWSQRAVAGADAPPLEEVRALESQIQEFFAEYPKMYLYEEGQRRGAMMCPVSTVADLMSNQQLLTRGYFHDVDYPEIGRTVPQPGAPFVMSEAPWRAGGPPRLGEHTAELLRHRGRPARDAAAGGTP